ncbi:hypothetical protein L6R52_03570 [Myxococcota bacterium]|nr:hypothetical protein [Myxococcota bacterium]
MTNKIGGPRSRGWIGQLETQRTKAAPPPADRGAAPISDGKLDRPAIAEPKGRAVLTAAGVPDKVAAQHGAALEGATKDLAAIAELLTNLPAWRTKQLGRTLEQLYKVLGQQLTHVPADARGDVASKIIASARALLAETGSTDLMVPALSAAIGLVDAGVRLQGKKVLTLTPAEAGKVFTDASDAVLSLVKSLDGRTGQSSAINVFGPLVEQLELGLAKMSQADRLAGFARVRDFLVETAPRRGVDMTIVAELAEHVAKAAAKHPRDPVKALADARATFLAPRAGLAEQAKAGLGEAAGVADGPGREALRSVERALAGVIAKSPAGPDSTFAAIDTFRADATNLAHTGFTDVLLAAEKIVVQHASSPAIEGLLKSLSRDLLRAAGHDAGTAALAAAAKAADAGALAQRLVDLSLALPNQRIEDHAGLADAVAELAKLPGTTALHVALTFTAKVAEGTISAGLLRALVDHARTSTPDDPARAFIELASRWQTAAQLLPQYPGLANDANAITSEIARVTKGPALDANAAHAMLHALQLAKQVFPMIDAKSLVDGDAAGRPGLAALADPAGKWAASPTQLLAQLLNAASPSVQGNKELQGQLARVAMELAAEAGHIHGGEQLHQRRILADWTGAVQQPEKLQHAARGKSGVALRAGEQQRSITQFLKAHPELPLDFALTAGQHLSPDQLAFVVDRIAKTRGRSTVRQLRDFTFGCIEAGRLDLLEAVRTSKSPQKAISAVMNEVAQSYRNARAHEVAYDAMIAGLAAGNDPIAEIVKQRTTEALAQLNLMELAEGKLDPKGVEEISKISANVADLLMQYSPNFKSTLDYDIDMGALRPIFLECLKSVIQGTWPKPKYENEVGKRIMASLTPAQQATWRQVMITPLDAAPVNDANGELAEAMTLLRGLANALPKEVRALGVKELGLELDWSARSLEALSKQRTELLEQLRASEKGSEGHRAASTKLGPVTTALAAIELKLDLDRTFANGAQVDARAVLMELRPKLEAASNALRKLGARGSAEAVINVLDVARELKTSPRQGRYAADEDGLTHMIDSHKSGCLSFGDQRRRWGLAGALADPNIRMLRVYDGDRQVYRAFLKFFHVTTPNYDGPALWVDGPVADGGGDYNRDLALLYKHVFEKARAMGVPVFGSYGAVPADFRQENVQMTVHIDDGNTGIMHSDSMFGGRGDIRTSRGANATWDRAQNYSIAFPANRA